MHPILRINKTCSWWSSSTNWYSNSSMVRFSLLCLRISRWRTVLCSKRSRFTKPSSASNNFRLRCNRRKSMQRLNWLKSMRIIITSRTRSLEIMKRRSKPWSISSLKPSRCQSSFSNRMRRLCRLSRTWLWKNRKCRNSDKTTSICSLIWKP